MLPLETDMMTPDACGGRVRNTSVKPRRSLVSPIPKESPALVTSIVLLSQTRAQNVNHNQLFHGQG